MKYTSLAAQVIAREWHSSPEEIEQWQSSGEIPDELAMHKNNTTPNRQLVLSQLLALCAAGYLKAEVICQTMGWPKTTISNALTYLRNPDTTDPRTLYGEEIDAVAKVVLQPLRTDLQALLTLFGSTPVDANYPGNLQEMLRITVAAYPALNPSRLTVGRLDTERRIARRFFAGDQGIITPKFRYLLSGIFAELGTVLAVLDGDIDALTEAATESAPIEKL